MPIQSSWDWGFLYYVGTVLLNMPSPVFWKTNPRKLNILSKIHAELNSPRPKGKGKNNTSSSKTGYIDQVL